ncbi:MAG: GAF domain-containing protein [Saprospiraceae bacterium]
MSSTDNYVYFKDEHWPDMPFDIRLSLERVFQFWENKVANGSASEKTHAQSILDSVSHAEELRHPISDISEIEKFHTEIEYLLSAMFPDILSTNEIKAASLPFFPVLFNMSKRLKGIIQKAGPDFKMAMKGFDEEEIYMLGCSFLIGVLYKVNVNFKRPLYFDIPDENGVVRHYRAFINGDFGKIIPKENFTPLTPQDIQLLIDNSRDLELWKKMIPPRTFTYEGIALITMFDQTEDESLSELKQLLLENNALQNENTLSKLQQQLAQYLSIDKVELGFEAFDEDSESLKALHGSIRPSKLMGNENESSVGECFCEYSADALLEKRDFFAISNVKELKDMPSQFIKRMYDKGVGSFIVAPLKYNNKIIAFIELTSPTQGVLNSMVASKLRQVLPMFTVAVSRSIDQHQTQLEAIIQDKFTSIHPTVGWKFMSSAERIFQNRVSNRVDEIEEDISFSNVYPLYGQFDIRGSSDARNSSIQADLLYQMDLADDILIKANQHDHLPIYQQLLFRINQFRLALGQSINAGDEVKILDFIRRELDPVFEHLNTIEEISPIVKQYRKSLDPILGVVYRQRKDYESSVTTINERISDYIENQQAIAQKMFPHYFEKYKTDGVEYNAYIGQSLLQNKTFHPMHLRNLRLWQLLITCGVENLHQSYKDELPMPLGITSLILAHSNPLAIRFRMDEKRFDVDGAYNIRYEILKKRIDKAYIKGTSERLTQPGKLSIVYSQDWEAEEYNQYLTYLQSIDYLDKTIERLDLEDLQGTAGLQALRVGFKYEMSPDSVIKEMMREVTS